MRWKVDVCDEGERCRGDVGDGAVMEERTSRAVTSSSFRPSSSAIGSRSWLVGRSKGRVARNKRERNPPPPPSVFAPHRDIIWL